MTALYDLSAVELIDRYRRKSLSPIDALDAVLAHIDRWEAHLNALYALDPTAARQMAEASAKRWQALEPAGPLDGVPVTIKENIATKGVPIPLGCAATLLTPAKEDAPPAARLRESGAVIVAKTTMPDYGMLTSGLSSFHKLTRNPWDLSKNPGGSSAGAGAAAAAGYGPIHIGTDIGGSIRLPAAWCGVVGFKPSFGRIPIDPPYVGRVAGPMTRTVADAALAMEVLARFDRRDGTALPPAPIPWSDLALDLKGLRIGVVTDCSVGMPLDPQIAKAVTDAARLLEREGAILQPAPAILTRPMLEGLDDFWRARCLSDIESLDSAARAKILPYILSWAESGARRSGLQIVRGFNQTFEMRKAASNLFADIDFLLSPTAPCLPCPADLASPLHDPDRPFEHIAYTVVWNMSEHPCLSINCATSDEGLPIGLQIVGQRFDDLGVLRLAKAYEDRRPAQRPWPAPFGQ